jgi:hypothetical protein
MHLFPMLFITVISWVIMLLLFFLDGIIFIALARWGVSETMNLAGLCLENSSVHDTTVHDASKKMGITNIMTKSKYQDYLRRK